MEESSYYLTSLEINIPVTAGQGLARNEAGSCEMVFAGMYSAKQSKMLDDMLDLLEIGQKVEVSGGYGTPVVLFVGLVVHTNFQYTEEGVRICVTAMDATWTLRGGPKTLTDEDEDPNRLIKELLGKCTEKGYAKLGKIDNISAEKLRLVQARLDDGQLLQLLARRAGCTFAIVHGQVLFTELYTKTSPLITLTYGNNLVSFQKETDVDKQVGKILVTAIGPDQMPMQASATSVTIPSTGKMAAIDTVATIKKKLADFEDPLSLTPEGLQKVAQAIFNERAMGFVRGSGVCVGLPELVPGRYLKVDGMDSHTNGVYFITRVVHRYGSDGFTTRFSVGGAWSN